jgi:hypothetical protein
VLANLASGLNPDTGCPLVTYPTAVRNHRCLPTSAAPLAARNAVMDQLNRMGLAGFLLSDFEKAAWPLAVIGGLAAGFGLGLNVMMIVEPHFVVMTSFVASVIMSWLATVFLWEQYDRSADTDLDANRDAAATLPLTSRANRDLHLFLAIAATVVAVFTAVAAWVYRHRVRSVWALYTESVYSLGGLKVQPKLEADNSLARRTPSVRGSQIAIVGLPLAAYLLVFGLTVLYGWTLIHLLSYSDRRPTPGTTNVVYDRATSSWLWFAILAFLLHLGVIVATQSSIVAHAVVRMYFSRSLAPAFGDAARTTIRYHFGSCVGGAIATLLGSLFRIPASWMLLRAGTESFGARLSDLHPMVRIGILLGSPTRTAVYANQAIYSQPFVESCRNSQELALKNVPHLGNLSSTMWFSLYSLKVVVVAMAMMVTILWVGIDLNLQYSGAMILLGVLHVAIAAEVVFAVYDVASGATLACVAVDIGIRNGSSLKELSADDAAPGSLVGSPYYCESPRQQRVSSNPARLERESTNDEVPQEAPDRLSLLQLVAREERRFQSVLQDKLAKQVEEWLRARNNSDLALGLDVYRHHERALMDAGQTQLLAFDLQSFEPVANVERYAPLSTSLVSTCLQTHSTHLCVSRSMSVARSIVFCCW